MALTVTFISISIRRSAFSFTAATKLTKYTFLVKTAKIFRVL